MTTQPTTSATDEIYIPQTLGGASGATTATLTTLVQDSKPLAAAMQQLNSELQNLSLSMSENSAKTEVVAGLTNVAFQGASAVSDFSAADAHRQAGSEHKALNKEFNGEFDPETKDVGKITRENLELSAHANDNSAVVGNQIPEGFVPREMSVEDIENEKSRNESEFKSREKQIEQNTSSSVKNREAVSKLTTGLGQLFHATGAAASKVQTAGAQIMGATASQTATTLGSLLQLLMGAINSNNANGAAVAYFK